MNYKEIKEKVINYLKEIKSESKKVVWPGRNYVTAATIIVFVIVFLVAGFVMLVDFGFARFFGYMTRGGMR
ncbi:MAG: preprotein translocase subunit SecE [bacterium]